MNDLYNDLSSSDEEEDSPSPANTNSKSPSQVEEKKEKAGEEEKIDEADQANKNDTKKKSSSKNKGYTKEQMLKDAQNLEKKKIAMEANEALKELYGDDYEEPGNPFADQNPSQKNNLTGKVSQAIGSWFTQAKDKYNAEMSNP